LPINFTAKPLHTHTIQRHLRLWTSARHLETAAGLLDSAQIIFYRSAAAALFPREKGFSSVNFVAAPKSPQGFKPAEARCSICRHRQRLDNHCPHVAALIGACLTATEEGIFPAPLLYNNSPWQALAGLTASTVKLADSDIRAEAGGDLVISHHSLTVTLRLPETAGAALAMFPEIPSSRATTHHEAAQAAADYLFKAFRTKTEQALNNAGRKSKGQQQEQSVWSQLCRHLCLRAPVPRSRLRREADHLFTLIFESSQESEPLCAVTPERGLTMRLLKETGCDGLLTIEGEARACSKITFDEEGGLTIEPRLILPDGESRPRRALREMIHGRYCTLAGTLWHPVIEQKHPLTLPDAGHASMPLFSFAAAETAKDKTLRVPPEQVPEFLEMHREHIINDGHEYDPSLEDFSIRDLPDSIVVDDFDKTAGWYSLSARYVCGERRLDLREILALREENKEHATGRTSWLRVKNSPLDWLYELAEERMDSDTGAVRLNTLEMMALSALVPRIQVNDSSDRSASIRERLRELEPGPLADTDLPRHLRPYQRAGASWLHHLFTNRVGGILADAMGLGKTHQALALLRLALGSGQPCLVVCPASVLPHWQDKIDEFYPEVDYAVHYGPGRRLPDRADIILLTTYGVMLQDIDLLENIPFSAVIFDEIQHLKNTANKTSKAARRLRFATCFGLSGTPIENSLSDLKAVMDQCLPGLLGSNAWFHRTYVEPVEERRDKQRLADLRRLISPFILRRKKDEVLTELPAVIDDLRHCRLSAEQVDLYRQVIEADGQSVLSAALDRSAPVPHMGFLAVVQRLKQICNHPVLLAGGTDYRAFRSGKWELFKEIISECMDAGLKVVVFSQYTKMLDLIERYLDDEAIPWQGLRGADSQKKRKSSIDSFNNDPDTRVFCASLLAGGTGIDLTGAQAVIHYDRWWNPAREEQATARVHRFGQKAAVQVFKFITSGTIEEKIHEIIIRKRDISDEAIEWDEASVAKSLDREEIISILRWVPEQDNG